MNIAVLVSGGGTNLQALLDAQRADELGGGKIVRVIASRADAYALERAAKAGISTAVVERSSFANAAEFDSALLAELSACNAELVVLAGFLCILGADVVAAYPNRILNVHPALIPAFSGQGFYGLRVHEAVLAQGVRVTGATVHLVNDIPDGGPIVYQKAVRVFNDDTPEKLQRRVMEQAEWPLLTRAVARMCEGNIHVEGNRAVAMDSPAHPY